jgi:hypothetical protein
VLIFHGDSNWATVVCHVVKSARRDRSATPFSSRHTGRHRRPCPYRRALGELARGVRHRGRDLRRRNGIRSHGGNGPADWLSGSGSTQAGGRDQTEAADPPALALSGIGVVCWSRSIENRAARPPKCADHFGPSAFRPRMPPNSPMSKPSPAI